MRSLSLLCPFMRFKSGNDVAMGGPVKPARGSDSPLLIGVCGEGGGHRSICQLLGTRLVMLLLLLCCCVGCKCSGHPSGCEYLFCVPSLRVCMGTEGCHDVSLFGRA